MSQNEPRHLDLVDRLRGQYHLPVNDGAGPLNGSMTFSREFPTPPIQKEAAAEIEKLRTALREIEEISDDCADVDDGEPNDAMRVLVIARAALGLAP